MADIIFINRSSVKWNDTYDSYMVNSLVGGDTEAGASLTLGSSEVLSATGVIVSTAYTTLTAGIAELLASSQSATSSTPDAELIIGIEETLTSTIINSTNISGWVELGVATDLDGDAACISSTTITTELSLGIVEVVSSTIATASVTAGPLLTIGQGEALTSSQTPTTDVNGLLDLGVTELLASTSINASTTDAWLQMGLVEFMTATATCVVAETTKDLTMGVTEVLSSTGVAITTVVVSLLDTGVSEILATTDPIISTVSAAVLTLGIDEPLTAGSDSNSITSSPDLIIGQFEVLSATANTVIPVSIPQLVLGIQEATASTGAIVSTVLITELTLGEDNPVSSTINIESVISSFLILGVTEVLESSSTLVVDVSTPNLILGQSEILGAVRLVNSVVDVDLTLGIVEPLSSTLTTTSVVSNAPILIGIQELLAATNGTGTDVIANIFMGVPEPVSSSITFTHSVTAVALTMGITESLSASTHGQTSIRKGGSYSNLVIGIQELLASTSVNTASTAAEILIGGSEILNGTNGVVIGTTVSISTLIIGITEVLTSTASLNVAVSDITLITGESEVLNASANVSSDVAILHLILGINEYLSHTSVITTTVANASLILGVTEDLSATIGPISTTSLALLDLGVTEILADVDNVLSSNVLGDLTLGNSEPLGHTLFEFTSGPVDPYVVSTTPLATMDLGVYEILGSSYSTTSSTDAVLSIGAAELLKSSIIITSSVDNVFTVGIVEELSCECVSWTSVSGLLVVGLTEVLASTSFSISVTDAAISFGVPEPLSHNIGDATIPGIPLNTGSLFIDGEEFIQDENETHTITPQGGTAVSTVKFKYGESSIYFDGEGDGMTIPDHTDFNVQQDFTFDVWVNISDLTNWDRLFIVQNDEDNYFQAYIYNNQIVCRLNKNGTIYDGIMSGTVSTNEWNHIAFTHIHATNTLKMYVNGVEVTGTTNATMEAITYFNGYFDNIRWASNEILWTSNFDSEDLEEMKYEVAEIPELFSVSNVVSDLTIGHIESLTHTNVITTEADALTMVTGVAEILASATFSVSVTTAELFLGIIEPLSASISNESNIGGILTLGADTVLEHTSVSSFAEMTAVAELGFGVSEYMGGANANESFAVATLMLGADEPLSATASIEQSAIALLGFGVIETASVSTSFTSSSDADLTIGIEEYMSATSSPSLSMDAEIFMGVDTPMESTGTLVQSNATATIIFGVNELAAATSISNSVADASLTIGTEEYMTSTGVVISNTVAFINFGVVEPLSATQEFVSTGVASAILGVNEVLSSTSSLAQSSTLSALSLGGMEMIAGGVSITSYGVALLDLGVSEILGSTGDIVSNVGSATLSFGVVEDLSFTNTTNIVGETGNLFIDGEFIVEDENETHTITNYGNISLPFDSIQGYQSVAFDGDGDYLSISDHDDFNFGSGDFTIDTWIKTPSNIALNDLPIISQMTTNSDTELVLFHHKSGGFKFYVKLGGSYLVSLSEAAVSISGDTWYHIAVVRYGNTWSIYKNGVSIASLTNTSICPNYTGSLLIGNAASITTSYSGNMDNIRVTKGSALWTSNFNVETDLDYPGVSINNYVGESAAVAAITMGVSESLSSTINFSTESDGSIAAGIIEVLATLGFGLTITSADITLGVDEPLSATNSIVSLGIGDLGIPGVIEDLSSSINIVSYGVATSLDTGVTEMVSAFKMIWSQIHTPPLTMGVTELINGTSDSVSLVGAPELIAGLTEVITSTTMSNTVADATLTLGVGEVLTFDKYAPAYPNLATDPTKASASSNAETADNCFSGTTAQWSNLEADNQRWIQYTFAAPTVVNMMSIKVGSSAPDYTPSAWDVLGWSEATGWDVLANKSGYTAAYWSPGKVATFGISNTTAYSIYRIDIAAVNQGVTPGIVKLDEIEMWDGADAGHFTAVAQSAGSAILSTGDDELMSSTVITTGATGAELIFGLIEVISATRVVNTVTIGQMFMGLNEIMEGSANVSTDVNNDEQCMGRTPMQFTVTGDYSSKGGIFITT